MLVDSDTVSLDTFPTNVVVYDEPLPRAESGGSTVKEVLVIDHGEHSGVCAETKAQSLGRRLAASAEEKTRSRLPATVGLASP